MKTKFEISQEVFGVSADIEKCFEYYEKYYKKHEFELDKTYQDVYKVYNKEIQLNVGDRIRLFDYRIVTWKCIDVENDTIVYVLETE